MDKSWRDNESPSRRVPESFDSNAIRSSLARLRLAEDSPEYYLVTRLMRRRTTEASVVGGIECYIHFFGWLREQDITPFALTEDEAEDYITDMRRAGYHTTTISMRMGAARQFYDMAARYDHVLRNPFRFMKMRKGKPLMRTPSLAKEDVEALLNAIYDEFGNYERGLIARRDYALILLLAWTALRSVEVKRMVWQDLYNDRGELKLRVHGKGGKEATIPVPRAAAEALDEWRAAFAVTRGHNWRPFDAVFPSLAERERYTVRTAAKTGKPLASTCAQGLSLIVRERLADIGITGKQLGAHCLRATAATIAIAAGASLQEVRELMRHDWSSTTEGYVAWEQIRHANAQDRLNYRLPNSSLGAADVDPPPEAADPPEAA